MNTNLTMGGYILADNVIQEQPKKKKGPLIIIIVLLVVILFGGGFFGYSFLTKSFFFAEGDSTVVKQRKEVGTVPFPAFVINLNAGTAKRYLKVDMMIGCTDEKDVTAITEKSYQIRDVVIYTLRKKTVVDVATVENTNLIKKELKDNINTLFDPDLDIEIYFIDYLVQ